jgi:hypothetical protein
MKAQDACAVILGVAFLLNIAAIIGPEFSQVPALAPGFSSAGAVLWKGRPAEVILQGLIILAGVFSILLLLRSHKSGGNRR